MKKPVYYRQATWDFVVSTLGKSAFEKTYNDNAPGKAALASNIVNHPNLLQDTVIELDDECDYVIDLTAARQIKNREKTILLKRLGDQKEKIVLLNEIIKYLRTGATFDQLTLKL